MHYSTVFDVSEEPFRHWWFALAGLGIVAGSFALPKSKDRRARVILRVLVTSWSVWALVATVVEDARASDLLRAGHVTVTVGTISDFVAGDELAHKPECFSFGAQRYCYRSSALTPWYNGPPLFKADPLHPGVGARVWHDGPHILKLQIEG